MSAYGDLREDIEVRPSIAITWIDLTVAIIGSLAAFRIFGFYVGLLVSGWWCLTLVIIKSDLENLIIPNWATLGVASLGFIYAAFCIGGVSSDLSLGIDAIGVVVARALLTFVGVAGFAYAFKYIRGHECLGFGDVKLSGALAIWLNAYDLLVTLELACFAALALVALSYLRNKRIFVDGVIPFGAFLAPAAWLVFLAHFLSTASSPWHAFIA